MGSVDSSQAIFITQLTLTNYLSLIAVVISIIALVISWLSFRRARKISEPKISHWRIEKHRVFIYTIEDYSVNRNLRIDKVKIKYQKKFFYRVKPIPPPKYLSDLFPQIIELSIINDDPFIGFKLLIYTNHKKLKAQHGWKTNYKENLELKKYNPPPP